MLVTLASFSSAAALTAVNVTPNSTVVGTSDVAFNITLDVPTAHLNMSNITVEFPTGYTVSGASVISTITIPSSGTVAVSGQNVTYNFANTSFAADTNVSLEIAGITINTTTGLHTLAAYTYNMTDTPSTDLVDSGTGTYTATAGNAYSINVNVTALNVTAGNSSRILASVLDQYGNVNSTTNLDWSSNASTVSEVTAGNNSLEVTVNGTLVGQALITVFHADNASATNSTVVTVTAGNITLVYVNNTQAYFNIGGCSIPTPIGAYGLDAQGNTNTTGEFYWASNDTNVATVYSGNGTTAVIINGTGISTGQANISVYSEHILAINATIMTVGNCTSSGTPTPTGGSSGVTCTLDTQCPVGSYCPSGYCLGLSTSCADDGSCNELCVRARRTDPDCSTSTSTPVPTSAPSVQPEDEEEPELSSSTKTIGSGASVKGSFGASRATFTLSYKPTSAFRGTVSFRLPFDYADYVSGVISLSPAPSHVEEGSLIAVWDVNLAANQEFKADVTVRKGVDESVLEEFQAPSTKAATTPADDGVKPTAIPTQRPASTGGVAAAPAAAAGPDYAIWIIVVVILVAIVGYYYYSQQSGKKK